MTQDSDAAGPAHHSDAEAIEATLAALLDDLAEEFADVERRESPDQVDYLVGTQEFARLTGATLQFRLRPEIALAATRTASATTSPLGREWVSFSPTAFDQYALDRAQAWFELGHRLAAEASRGAKRH